MYQCISNSFIRLVHSSKQVVAFYANATHWPTCYCDHNIWKVVSACREAQVCSGRRGWLLLSRAAGDTFVKPPEKGCSVFGWRLTFSKALEDFVCPPYLNAFITGQRCGPKPLEACAQTESRVYFLPVSTAALSPRVSTTHGTTKSRRGWLLRRVPARRCVRAQVGTWKGKISKWPSQPRHEPWCWCSTIKADSGCFFLLNTDKANTYIK